MPSDDSETSETTMYENIGLQASEQDLPYCAAMGA